MADSGVVLESLAVSHPRAADLQAAYAAIGLQGVAVTQDAPDIQATLRTPRGMVLLHLRTA